MKPIIGINLDFDIKPKLRSFIYPEYYDAVEHAGGIPLLIPPLKKKSDIKEAIKKIDGLILSGGDDIDPNYFRELPHPKTKILPERRGTFDIELSKIVLSMDLPILAICCGMQLLNVVRGGTLIQDIPSILSSKFTHRRGKKEVFHIVRIEKTSLIYDIIKKGTLVVNSSHHQAIGKLGKKIRSTATAPDGIIESNEIQDKTFAIGVQWHPEKLYDKKEHLAIFKALIDYAKK